MNEDSVFDIFKRSFSKLNLDMKFADSTANFCDDTFKIDWEDVVSISAEKEIKKMVKDKSSLVLVPVISFRDSNQSGLYFTSSGAVGGSRYQKRNDLFLTMYLMMGDEILYRRTAVHLTEFYPAYEISEIQHLITQEDWDKLVALVMKDYMDRLKKE